MHFTGQIFLFLYVFGIALTGEQLSCDSSKKRKEFLVLTCGQRTINACTSVTKGKGEDGESCSDDESEDEENRTVCFTALVKFIVYYFGN